MEENDYIEDIIKYFESKRDEEWFIFRIREEGKRDSTTKTYMLINLFLVIMVINANFITSLFSPRISFIGNLVTQSLNTYITTRTNLNSSNFTLSYLDSLKEGLTASGDFFRSFRGKLRLVL